MIYQSENLARVYAGDCRYMKELPDNSVHCVVTSPPYWGLRRYKGLPDLVWGGREDCQHEWGKELVKQSAHHAGETNPGIEGYTKDTNNWSNTAQQYCSLCGAWRGQLGSEPTIEMFVAHTVEVCREVKRVLRPDGIFWLNIGDSMAGSGSPGGDYRDGKGGDDYLRPYNRNGDGLKPLDSCLVPFRLALALQQDGWYVRSDIIWCLSGGTWVYAKTQSGETVCMLRDLRRLKPETVQLWNGEKWTQLKGISKTKRIGNEIELVLRSGERIACTPTHQFPTDRGLLQAGDIRLGDKLQRVILPGPEKPRDCALDSDAAWLVGLYLAEGSMADDCIQIAGHSKETERWERCQLIATKYGGYATHTVNGNTMNIRLYGKVLRAILSEFVSGHIAKNKALAPVVWRYSDSFVETLLRSYLDGDGHWENKNNRWRIGFTRNYSLERDLRVACARLGWHITLKTAFVQYKGKPRASFRGEIRMGLRSGHHNEKNREEVIEIRKARSRDFYDVGVTDEPHLFALASGILTHNSKNNPMPESLNGWRWEKHRIKIKKSKRDPNKASELEHPQGDSRHNLESASVFEECPGCPICIPNDGYVLRQGAWRPTNSHEYIFMLTKTDKYYADREAVKEAQTGNTHSRGTEACNMPYQEARGSYKDFNTPAVDVGGRNSRSVWSFPTFGYPGAHFATFPPELPLRCIKASTSEVGVCSKCGKPWVRVVYNRPAAMNVRVRDSIRGVSAEEGYKASELEKQRYKEQDDINHPDMGETKTLGWRPSCNCNAPASPAIVLDPFAGSGTTLAVAKSLGHIGIGYELSTEYLPMIKDRLEQTPEGVLSNQLVLI